jgi:hypothetical protein
LKRLLSARIPIGDSQPEDPLCLAQPTATPLVVYRGKKAVAGTSARNPNFWGYAERDWDNNPVIGDNQAPKNSRAT